jgi:chemotaxis protein methyltransferase CheR
VNPTPDAAAVERFREAVRRHTGLRLDEDHTGRLPELLAARLRATGAADVEAYLSRLEDPVEVGTVADGLVVPETYFLRGAEQLRVVVAHLQARLAAGAARPLRVISAGCSTGEEPYSLALLLREAIGDPAGTVAIDALDLSPAAIARARAARYAPWSLRDTPPDVRARWFTPAGGGFLLAEPLRALPSFQPGNLVRPDVRFWPPGSAEAICCRNVLMYFEPAAARAVIRLFARTLVPGGLLLLGHAENLRGLSRDFHLGQDADTFFYRRRTRLDPRPLDGDVPVPAAVLGPGPMGSPATPPDASWFEAIGAAARRIAELADRSAPPPAAAPTTAPPDLAHVLGLMEAERFAEALAALGAAPAGSPREDADALLVEAVLRASSGDVARAEMLGRRLLALDELNAGAHYLMALCRERAGDLAGAVAHDRAAAHLDAAFAMPRLHLGVLERRRGRPAEAQRELAAAADLLQREDPARVVLFGGGFGREALLGLCAAERAALGGTP